MIHTTMEFVIEQAPCNINELYDISKNLFMLYKL